MSASRCPGPIELTRHCGTDADPALAAHLAACPRCANEWSATARLVALARGIEESPVGVAQHEQLRLAVLRAARAPAPPVRERSWFAPGVVAACAIAAAAALTLWGDRDGAVGPVTASGTAQPPPSETVRAAAAPAAPAETRRGIVHAAPGAEVVRLAAAPDEIVRLREGTIAVAVAPLHRGERFRVITEDAEIEVRGTAFIATAVADTLSSVEVQHGVVEVRPAHRATVLLRAGDRWTARPARRDRPAAAPARTAAPAMAIADTAAAVPARSAVSQAAQPARDSAAGATAPDTAAEAAFNAGWDALRSGDAGRAATAFERAAAAAGSEAIGEDAWFWRAVALARAGRRAESMPVLRAFLTRYPTSARAGEAAAILGWQLVDRGELDAAARLFETAAADPNGEVRDSGRRGLREIARRRARQAP